MQYDNKLRCYNFAFLKMHLTYIYYCDTLRCLGDPFVHVPGYIGLRIQRQDMITSAKNDAAKAKGMANKSPSGHRRQLGTTWSVLARLEVLYFPKDGKKSILDSV